jgi:DMSO/TMAO reductase YedYZ molybdopterin-dependent catalytic subunit
MMERLDPLLAAETSRRRLLAMGAVAAAAPVLGQAVDLRLADGGGERATTDAFPGKRGMILQRTRAPLLETPMSVFDAHDLTPNDRFFVRWHWDDIPTAVDVRSFRLRVGGHVTRSLAVSLEQLLRLPRIEYVAVNQCSGNSRGFFQPRVPGAQWGHGAMGNARWTGVSLRRVLDLAGVRPGARHVRFGGLDRPLVPGAPDYLKSLAIDHARDGEVMIAFQMNGEQLPLLNGFPLRLVVPGWFSTYWVKALDTIEVLAGDDPQYWMAKAYRLPATPRGGVAPGAKGFPTVPINQMPPRSWLTSVADGQRIAFRPALPVSGIALGGAHGVARVAVSADRGRSWRQARLGQDLGRYSFRRWSATVPVAAPGPMRLMVRCWNTAGEGQPLTPIWNPSGYARDHVEVTTVMVT